MQRKRPSALSEMQTGKARIMEISVAKLKKARACEDQVALFAKLFGDKPVPVTLERCKEAAATELDLGWAARKLFSNSAFIAYYEAIAPAWKAFNEAIAPARKAYDEAIAAALKISNEVTAIAFYNASKINRKG